MKKMADSIHAKDGILATLGNHDTYLMVDFMENLGIKVLANETISIKKDNEKISVTGIDDPHYYFTDQALVALEESSDGYKIALVHSPELYDAAADNGYSLYLCGHTHGGQIALPGGIALITHLHNGRKYYRGLWRHSQLVGYTNQGSGTVGIPVRFNTQSEIALITLIKP
jgi:predicted MPP superfamily phosphohydrolase